MDSAGEKWKIQSIRGLVPTDQHRGCTIQMETIRDYGKRTMPLLAGAALALVALVGCAAGTTGSGDGSPAPSGATSAPATPSQVSDPAAGPATGADADLAIILTSNGTDVAERYRLVCVNGAPGQGGNHPQAKQACTFLSGEGKTLLTTSAKTEGQCTQQTAGPQTAIVEGKLNGTSVQRAFSLDNGCKISAWKSAEALLGRGTSSGAQ